MLNLVVHIVTAESYKLPVKFEISTLSAFHTSTLPFSRCRSVSRPAFGVTTLMFVVGRQWLMLWLLSLPSMAESAGSRILVQANFISHVRRSQQNVRKVKIKFIVAGLYQAALQLPAASRPVTLTSHLLHPALQLIT